MNKTYNGEWAYAMDEKGRALINSDPANWPYIVNWLSFGPVPPSPTPGAVFVSWMSSCTASRQHRFFVRVLTPVDVIALVSNGMSSETNLA